MTEAHKKDILEQIERIESGKPYIPPYVLQMTLGNSEAEERRYQQDYFRDM
jgi:hypothetical protein